MAYPNYSSISNPNNNNDLENQVHQNNQYHHHQHHHHHQHQQPSNTILIETRIKRKNGCCCCSFPCLVIILILMILYASFQKYSHMHGGWGSKDVYYSCNNMDSPNIQWQGISTYYVPQDIKYLQIIEMNERSKLYLDNGKVKIIENNNLNQTKITFDLRISNDLLQKGILINDKRNGNKLELEVLHVKNKFNGCVQINTLIEIPSSSNQLDKLKIGYLNSEIRIKDTLTLNEDLAIDLVNGNLIIEDAIKTKILEMNVVNGDIRLDTPATISTLGKLNIMNGELKGRFHLNQSKLDAAVVNGVLDLGFDSISPVSTISTSVINGITSIQVPNNFDSSYKLTATIGKTDVRGHFPENVHYQRSTHIFGETINGYYGDKDNNPSKIDATTVNGEINLYYK